MSANFKDIRFYSQRSSAVLMRTLRLISVDIPAIITIPRVWKLQTRVLNRLYGPVKFSGPTSLGSQLWLIMWCLCYMCAMTHYCSLLVAGDADPWQKRPNKWKLRNQSYFFVIPKTTSGIPYPSNCLVSHPLPLKLFCHLSLNPKTPNKASSSITTRRVNLRAQ